MVAIPFTVPTQDIENEKSIKKTLAGPSANDYFFFCSVFLSIKWRHE